MRSDVDGARALVLCAGGGIGDSLLASVVARALHRRFASVDALTLPGHRQVLERVPDYDGVLVDDGGQASALTEGVAERGYAAAIVTWATARTAGIAKRTRIPVRVGQARRLYSASFTKTVVVRSERGDVTSHWTQILLDYARALGCDADDARPCFVPTAHDEEEARTVLARRGLEPQAFLILHPSNAQATMGSIWPTRGWAALARALHQRFAMPVAVTGSDAEVKIVERIVDDVNVVSLAGALSIGGFGAFARHARAFVGITTGVMHVAAAVGCPTVGIFPFQSDFPDRWAPLGERTEIVRPSFRCHPGDTKERCVDYACVENLDVQGVIAATEALLR
ncbi:MAG TPA: glycosyltransferase family 9 protein [Candidatus Tyrphobacter sp.]